MLNAPRKNQPPKVDVIRSRVPTPEEVPIMPQPVLKAAMLLLEKLNEKVQAKWAVGGDSGELFMGVNVNVNVEYLEILTTKEGCDEICKLMADYLTLAPAVAEKKLPRDADVDAKMYPVFIKSYYAELTIKGVKVEIYGDEQIKVGEWDWGDPLDYTADYTYVPGRMKLPLVPLSLKTELDLGLGWLDRVKLISDAVLQKHHDH